MALENTVTRIDVIALLASIGVRLACDTRMSLEALEKHVDDSLDLCQNVSCLGGAVRVDPDTLPRWAPDKPLLKSAAQTALLSTPNGSTPKPQKVGLLRKTETLKEMRQTLEFVAFACHAHCRDLVLMTPDLQKGIFIKILGVYNVEKDTPLFFVIYRELVSTPQTPMADLLGKLPAGKERRPQVTISDLENYAFHKLFKMNAMRLDPKHQALIDEKGGKKFQIRASFLLPLVPLSLRAAFCLSDSRCNTCGKRRAFLEVCQGCLTLAYCGEECRTKDSHNLFCDVLKGGSWTPITLADISKRNLMFIPDTVLEAGAKNIKNNLNHNDKVSLAQFNDASIYRRKHLTTLAVYDRNGSFITEWLRDERNRDIFDAVVKQGGKKFYRWVRHISGDQYDLCIDRIPMDSPYW